MAVAMVLELAQGQLFFALELLVVVAVLVPGLQVAALGVAAETVICNRTGSRSRRLRRWGSGAGGSSR